jgi:hypothetical protein
LCRKQYLCDDNRSHGRQWPFPWFVTNRKIRNLENIKGIDKNAEIWKLLYYLRQIKVNARG